MSPHAVSVDSEESEASSLMEHLDLLSPTTNGQDSEFQTTPFFTEHVRQFVVGNNDDTKNPPFAQYGLLAGDVGSLEKIMTKKERGIDPRIFFNTAAPSSVFICGSQGSGKSHSLSCLLENCLLPSSKANVLPRPLTGVVFHYDTFISDTGGSACEAAYLSSHQGVSVRVLCAPTNIGAIRRIYRDLPNVYIEELRINESDLNTSRMLDLMAVKSATGLPLYLFVINRILRELRVEQQTSGSGFKYAEFKRRIDAEALTDGQLAPLQQRLDNLESFMNQDQAMEYRLQSCLGGKGEKNWNGVTRAKKTQKNVGNDWTPKAGQLTIVDLSCPCVTAEMACSLFTICLSLFLEQDHSSIGRVIALDEAHKFMNDSPECQALTDNLLATIRLQRHLAARVIISTQEPTISPKLLDLCSMTIVHRFTSPDWLRALKKHLAGASIPQDCPNEDENGDGSEANDSGINPLILDPKDVTRDLLSRIVNLKTGEALIFAPSALIGILKVNISGDEEEEGALETSCEVPLRLENGILKVRIRKRITQDGGRSIMSN